MRKGFSLVDVTLSVSVLAFIAYITASSFQALAPKYLLQRAVWEICSCLHSVRFTALSRGEKARVTFASSTYTIDIYDEDREEWEQREKHSLEGVSVEANNSPCFHPTGAVSNLASISVSNSWGIYKITVAITGRIKAVKSEE